MSDTSTQGERYVAMAVLAGATFVYSERWGWSCACAGADVDRIGGSGWFTKARSAAHLLSHMGVISRPEFVQFLNQDDIRGFVK